MPQPLGMWVDMDEEGGGFDMYAITGGSSVNDARNNHSGTALGFRLGISKIFISLESKW